MENVRITLERFRRNSHFHSHLHVEGDECRLGDFLHELVETKSEVGNFQMCCTILTSSFQYQMHCFNLVAYMGKPRALLADIGAALSFVNVTEMRGFVDCLDKYESSINAHEKLLLVLENAESLGDYNIKFVQHLFSAIFDVSFAPCFCLFAMQIFAALALHQNRHLERPQLGKYLDSQAEGFATLLDTDLPIARI